MEDMVYKDKLQYGIQPFWFWNGEMKEEEIKRQVKEMAQKGIKGFFIHPRQGMEIPYLSKEYFRRVRCAVEEAKVHGLEVWLYDEYPYPSGVSGGEVLLDHPEYLAKTIEKVICTVTGGKEVRLSAPWGKVLSVKAYPITNQICDYNHPIELEDYVGTGYGQEVFQLSGMTRYNNKRYFTGDPEKVLLWTPPEGQYRIYFFVETIVSHFKYFEHYVDPLNKDAIRYFIETTHERYKAVLGDEFGKTIKGVFSDEVTAFPPEQPWSPLLPSLVKERYGIDLIQYLPALWEDMGEITRRVRFAYWNTITDTFIESYDKQIYEWCDKNELLYVGEKPILRSKELQFVHIPGIDTGHQKAGTKAKVIGSTYRSNGKLVSSAAHFYDKPGALCELGHSIGWGMTIQDMKWIMDWLAVQGITWYVIHAFYYTADGLKKHDAPPSAFYQMPWWEEMKQLSDYADNLSERTTKMKKKVTCLVIDPVTSTWTASQEEKVQLQEGFANLQNRMLEEQWEYYLIDPQLFAEGIVEIMDGKTVLTIHEEQYDTVVLAYATNLEDCAVRKLLEYTKHKGVVVCFSTIPTYSVETIQVDQAFQIIINNETAFFTDKLESFLEWGKKRCHQTFQIEAADEFTTSEVVSMQGTYDGKDSMLLFNLSSTQRTLHITYEQTIKKNIRLEPLESKDITREFLENREEDSTFYRLDLGKKAVMTRQRDNVLRLGRWEMKLQDGQTAQVECMPILDQIEMANCKMPVKTKKYFGCPKEVTFTGGQYRYSQKVICHLSGEEKKEIYLIVEPGTLVGDWVIRINQVRITPTQLKQKEIYAPTNLGVEVSAQLVEGINEIIVELNTDKTYGGMRNPLYLCGDFSVKRQNSIWCLESVEKEGYCMDRIASGLPYYSGRIYYEWKVTDFVGDKQDRCIVIDEPNFEDAVSLMVNDQLIGTAAWKPYRFLVPKEVIHTGENKITMVVDTTMLNLFEGQTVNYETHCYESID